MTPGAILDTLKAHGVRLTRDGGDLIATPKTGLTDELRALIRAHKTELLEAAVPVSTIPQEVTGGDPGKQETAKVEPSAEDRDFFRSKVPGAVISRKQAPEEAFRSIARQFENGDTRVMWFDQDSRFVMVAWRRNGIPQAPILLTIPPEQCDWDDILDRFEKATLQ